MKLFLLEKMFMYQYCDRLLLQSFLFYSFDQKFFILQFYQKSLNVCFSQVCSACSKEWFTNSTKMSLILAVNFEVYTFPKSLKVFLCVVQFEAWCNAKSYVTIRAEILCFFSDSLSIIISFQTAHCTLSCTSQFLICGSNYFQKMSPCQSRRIRL